LKKVYFSTRHSNNPLPKKKRRRTDNFANKQKNCLPLTPPPIKVERERGDKKVLEIQKQL
jgi:hypothetical protein